MCWRVVSLFMFLLKKEVMGLWYLITGRFSHGTTAAFLDLSLSYNKLLFEGGVGV